MSSPTAEPGAGRPRAARRTTTFAFRGLIACGVACLFALGGPASGQDAPAEDRDETLELLLSESVEDRREALTRLAGTPPDEELRSILGAIAESDPDAVAQGYAQLLLADWDAGEVAPVRTVAGQASGPPPALLEPNLLPPVPPLPDAAPVVDLETHLAGERSWIPPAPAGEETGPDDPFAELFVLPAAGEAFAEAGFGGTGADGIRPGILDRPLTPPEQEVPPVVPPDDRLYVHPVDAPHGFAGPSGVRPTETQTNSHFAPIEDRWRISQGKWDRYGKGHPPLDDYPYAPGMLWDPYRQNVLKGDYPIHGQHLFLRITGEVISVNEFRQLPTPTTPFESTARPGTFDFFGDPDQFFSTNTFLMRTELSHGNAGFKPEDWLIRLTPAFNANYLDVNELGIVSPDVRKGTDRYDSFTALQEYFAEVKLADTSPYYDFVSVRAGSQPFTSDFRGFVLSDINRGVRLFGTRDANRDQFNVLFFDQVEKDTNSQLNTFDDRNQHTLVMNYYRQDFVFPGYTALTNFHYNNDGPSTEFDRNGFLARPDPAGAFEPHRVESYYFGVGGEGHIGKINVSNMFYWVVGRDSGNPIGEGQEQDINAQMAAIELSIDRDWVRFRTSFFFASGDDDATDDDAEGFDTILDRPNFVGGEFSYWQRQNIGLFGVGLTQRESLVPDLRSSKFQGQQNFVNPGLFVTNFGADFEVTPKARVITNASYLWFAETDVLERFTFQDDIQRKIGLDLSVGTEYRPFLSDNVIFEAGVASLIPDVGFKDLYGAVSPFERSAAAEVDIDPLFMVFLNTILVF